MDSEEDNLMPHVYLFDVDGPISDPQERKVTEPKIIDELVSMSERSDIIALNTGRSIEWLLKGPKSEHGTYLPGQKGLIELLDERIQDKSLLKKFYAIGEKGGSSLRYQSGAWIEETEDIAVPKEFRVAIGKIINEEFSEWMFNDDTKRTMVTSEMKRIPDGTAKEEKDRILTEYHHQQQRLIDRIRPLIAEINHSDVLKIDPTVIATDILRKEVRNAC